VDFLLQYIVQGIITVSVAPGAGKDDYAEFHTATHNNKDGGILCRRVLSCKK
jgi:hypothetical protein